MGSMVRFERWGWAGLLVVMITTFGCDRVTKHLASVALSGAPVQSYLADTVRLEYAENTGAFLSLGATLPESVRKTVLASATSLVLIGTIFMAIKLRWSAAPLFGLALIFSGGASNLSDRLLHGHVIDFLNVGLGPLRTGIFNFADMAIMLGVVVMVRTRGKAGETAGEPAPPEINEATGQ
jgi:signal peptidase II